MLANRILQAAGLDPQRDIRAQSLGVAQSVDALKDGKIDAFFWNARPADGVDPRPGQHAGHSRPLHLDRRRSCRVCIRLRARSLYYTRRDSQGHLQDESRCPGRRPWPICSSCPSRCPRRSPTTSRGCSSTNRATLAAIHPQARELALETALNGSPIPFHPGAIRYYRERQVWSASSGRRERPRATRATPRASALAALRAVLGRRHRRSADLSRQLPADRAGGDVPRLSVRGRRALARGLRHAVDGLCIALAVAALAWPIVDFDAFVFRAATPTTLDLVLGAITTLLVLEATRRTTGWILPVTAACSSPTPTSGRCSIRLGLSLIAHRGYSVAADPRHALHDARGHLRRAARRHRDLHRAVHDLRRRARAQRRRPVLHRLGDGGGRPVAAAARAPAAPSPSRAICSAPSRAAASPTR